MRDGVHIGDLVWNDEKNKLNAHCLDRRHVCGGKTCHMDRTIGAKRDGQGRPVGLLVAWLLMHGSDEFPSKKSHQDAKKELRQLPVRQVRVAAREWAHQQDDTHQLFELELPAPDGDESEPDVVAS
jgi:hypothetical protein